MSVLHLRLRRIAMAALAAGLLGAASPAWADLKEGREYVVHGDYKAAEKVLKRVKGADEAKAQLELGRLAFTLGQLDSAKKIARTQLKARDAEDALQARLLLAELLRYTGEYAKAKDMLETQHKKHPDHLATRHGLARAYEDLGLLTKADQLWNLFYDDFEQGKLDVNNPEHLYYVGEAAYYMEVAEDASDMYQDAVSIDKNMHRANIAVGRLFVRKYAPGDAAGIFDDVLKINPKHPDALAGIAALKTGELWDIAGATKALDEILEINPNHIGAHILRANMAIDKNHWHEAVEHLQKALAVNPEHVEARATLATVHWLRDELKEYEAEKARVFKTNPSYGRFFHIVMRSADREHRYHEYIELGKEALRIDPKDYEGMQLLGSGYLRLGKEEEGMKWMRKAWRGDQFNQRTFNTLDLFEKIIPRSYEKAASKNFTIRYHKDERPVLERYVAPTLERAYADMVKRYGFEPQKPLTIELYQDPQHYAVRTVGLPSLGALGVCFGQVITAMSPSGGDLNWSMVLWHELAHVFAIQLSNYRVPRWFTEGLSEYETIRERPEWRRENDSDLWVAMQDGTLPSVGDLNNAFMTPNPQAVVVAYHLSSVTIEYLVAEYSFDVIVKALKLFGTGAETPEVIEKITGKTVAQFDEEFRAHLRRRLSPYEKSLHLPTVGMEDPKALAKAAKKKPKDASLRAKAALAFFYAGDPVASAEHAKKAIELDPGAPLAHYVLAELSMRERNADAARKHYETIIKAGHDHFDIRVRLAMIAARTNKKDEAVKHLQTAKVLDPERSYPYQALAELYEEEGKTDEALAELETFVMIEQMDFGALKKLIDGYAKKADWGKVVTYGEMGVRVDPAHGALQLTLGRAYLERKQYDEALYAFDTALVIRPRLRRPAQAHIGRAKALRALGKNKEAKKAIELALDLEPENAEALKMKKNK